VADELISTHKTCLKAKPQVGEIEKLKSDKERRSQRARRSLA